MFFLALHGKDLVEVVRAHDQDAPHDLDVVLDGNRKDAALGPGKEFHWVEVVLGPLVRRPLIARSSPGPALELDFMAVEDPVLGFGVDVRHFHHPIG